MVKVKQAKGLSAAQIQERDDERAKRLAVLGLRPDDEIRFPKVGSVQAYLTGRPVDVNSDGSVNCIIKGATRAVLPEKIQVKMRGPRGGIKWEDLVPK